MRRSGGRGAGAERRDMMKKTVLVVFFCGFSILCFARGNLEAYGGMPIIWDQGEAFGYEAKVQTTAASFGIGFVVPQKNGSFGVFDEVILPLQFDGTIDGEQATVKRDVYDQLIGVSCLLGGVFNLYKNSRLTIPLLAGVRWMWVSMAIGSYSSFGNNIGFEAGIGAEYQLTNRIFLFGRLRGVYDFYAITLSTEPVLIGSAYTGFYSYKKSSTSAGFISSFGINPNIGIGFRL
jgi:hypothetical protein